MPKRETEGASGVQDTANPRQRLPLPAKRMHKVSEANQSAPELSVCLGAPAGV